MKWHHTAKLLSVLSLAILTAPGKAADIAGRTLVALGQVEAAGEQSRSLKRRSPVYDIDTVTTGANSKAQFKMMDGGLLAVKENTQLLISTYKYDPETDTGSAVMNLLSGGIRTISGKIKNENGEYQLKTPVGSIGIRGTHFEVELVGGDLFVAVWDGAIDLNVETSGIQETVSFGANEQFNFGRIQANGQVTGLLTVPEVFDSGHSVDPTPDSEEAEQTESDESSDDENASSADNSTTSGSNSTGSSQQTASNNTTGGASTSSSTSSSQNGQGQSQPTVVDNNQSNYSNLEIVVDTSSQPSTETTTLNVTDSLEIVVDVTELEPEVVDPQQQELQDDLQDNPIFGRTGTASFALASHDFGENITDVNMSMQINFDAQTVEQGFLSFTDEGGEWLARFNGAIRDAELDLGVNYAHHGNNLAEGTIDARFIEADTISGSVELSEQEDESVTAGGDFTLGESASPTSVDEVTTDL